MAHQPMVLNRIRSLATAWAVLPGVLVIANTAMAGHPIEVREIERHGITWTFDQPVLAGQFVNGDWWIVPPAGADGVTVVSVSPAPGPDRHEGKAINGSMVNPMPGKGQAIDERAPQWRAENGATFPLTLKVNQSLLSSQSREVAPADRERHWRPVNHVAVLTCLAEPAGPTIFRPPYVGDAKPLYDSATLQRERLPRLAPAGDVPDMEALVEARFSRPWIEFPIGWSANTVRSLYESGYGREKAVDVGGAGLLLCLDPEVIGDKEPLLIGLVQVGIDLYYTLINGGRWPADGGHAMGRKFPILFAGLMLDDQGMLGIGEKYPAKSNTFQEDAQAFIVTREHLDLQLGVMIRDKAQTAGESSIGVVGGPGGLPGYTRLRGNQIKIIEGPGAGQVRTITGDSAGWQHTNRVPKVVECEVEPAWETVPVVGESVYQVLGFQEHHIGRAEWAGSYATNPEGSNPSIHQSYRHLNKYAWPGQVLAARILGLKEAWQHDAVFLLIDQYMADTAEGGPRHDQGIRTWSSSPRGGGPNYQVSGGFISRMWDTYR